MKLNMNMKNNLNKKIYRYKSNYKYMSIHLNSVCANSELKYIIYSKLNIKYIKTMPILLKISFLNINYFPFFIYTISKFFLVFVKKTQKNPETYIFNK